MRAPVLTLAALLGCRRGDVPPSDDAPSGETSATAHTGASARAGVDAAARPGHDAGDAEALGADCGGVRAHGPRRCTRLHPVRLTG